MSLEATKLFFGLTENEDESGLPESMSAEKDFEPADDQFWFAHPLAEGADSLYRFRSGDTLTVALPDGRQLQAVSAECGAPGGRSPSYCRQPLDRARIGCSRVRAVFRLSRQFDAIRDVPELQKEEDRGSFKYVPGLFKPWTFDLSVVAVDYSLWEFETWLPRSMRLEGEAAAGILKIPVSMDLSYEIESVTLATDSATEAAPAYQTAGGDDFKEVHFETRAEAMAFIGQLLSGDDEVDYVPMEESGGRSRATYRESLLIVPRDRSRVAVSPHLPPPIWEDAPGFISDDMLEKYVRGLADLPVPRVATRAWDFSWGWKRPDLIRYNRVEGPSVGGRFNVSPGGPYTLGISGFFGLADLQPKLRLDLERATPLRRLSLGAFRGAAANRSRGRILGLRKLGRRPFSSVETTGSIFAQPALTSLGARQPPPANRSSSGPMANVRSPC